MSLNIVTLIENNPITKFTDNYQSKLIEKIQQHFSNYEQQLFLSSFYCYLKYDPKNDFVIDLDIVWSWIGFGQKVNAKRLLENYFKQEINYKVFAQEDSGAKKSTRGGHNKEIIMLNIETFKKFCLKAGTKKADEIHDYFIKLENIMFEITQEECEKLKDQLLKLEDTKNKEIEDKLKEQKVLEREKVLLKQYANSGPLVYIIKVKSLEYGQYIVKIGESRRGVLSRYNEHKSKYDECLLLDCFPVTNSKDFESLIHNHENIRLNKVKDLEGHETELELFLIGKHLSYQGLLNIINHNIKHFNNTDIYKLEQEIEQYKTMIEMNKSGNDNILIQELIKSNKQIMNKLDALEQTNKLLVEKINSLQTKTTNGFNEQLPTVGPRLQKIHPETLQLVKVYETVSEAIKENNSIKRSSVNKAVLENTIYNGFRWQIVDRELDPNVIHNISPTKETRLQNLGFIAKLNKEKTKILNVYLDRKTAAKLNNYPNNQALDNPVKNFTLTNNHYYMLYDNCDDELKTKFETDHGTPQLYKCAIGYYDTNNNLLREFTTKQECIKTLSMSDKTLSKCLEENKPYNGKSFKDLKPKLQVIN